MQRLQNAEAYFDQLLSQMRDGASKLHGQMDETLDGWSKNIQARERMMDERAKLLYKTISNEMSYTLKQVVDMVNETGTLLPIPCRSTLRSFLLSLPKRLSIKDNVPLDNKLVLMANEAIILIRSLIQIMSSYLHLTKNP